jgi:hypothetical protein
LLNGLKRRGCHSGKTPTSVLYMITFWRAAIVPSMSWPRSRNPLCGLVVVSVAIQGVDGG